MNDLVKSLMAWGGLGWPGGGLERFYHPGTIREPAKTIRDLEAGWTAGWAALGWRGLATGLGGYSRLAGLGWAG